MKKVWFFFDYGGEPVWYQTEMMISRVTGLPPEVEGNKELFEQMMELKKEYKSLFINNSYEFTYVGFKDEESWRKFINKVNDFIKLLKSCVEPEYEVHLEQWERSRLSKTWLID